MGDGDERGVVVPADPGAAFVVVEAELALELFVVELDLPAQPGEPGEPLGLGVGGEVGDPVVDRRVGAGRAIRRSAAPRGGRAAVPFCHSCAALTGANTNCELTGLPSGPSRKPIVWVWSLPSLAISSLIASGSRSGRGRLFGLPVAAGRLGNGEHGLGREHLGRPRRPRARTRAPRRGAGRAARCCRRRPGRRAPAPPGPPSPQPASTSPTPSSGLVLNSTCSGIFAFARRSGSSHHSSGR